jgi:hypothetical protein
VAEELRFGHACPEGCRTDLYHARRCAAHKGERDVPGYVERMAEETKAILRQPVQWAGVRLLAEALVERERLTGDEVRQLWDQAESVAIGEMLERLRAIAG